MAVKKVVSVRYISDEGFSLSAEPVEDTLVIKRVRRPGVSWEARYLVHDSDPVDPWVDGWAGIGRFVHHRDYGREQLKEYAIIRGCDSETREELREGDDCPVCGEALPLEVSGHLSGCAPSRLDAVGIDKYEHGGVSYSVRGEGMQCRWDSSRLWAYWLPDKDITLPRSGPERRAALVSAARSACELFNQYVGGEVYGVVRDDFGPGKVLLGSGDSCYGFYGLDNAKAELDNPRL